MAEDVDENIIKRAEEDKGDIIETRHVSFKSKSNINK